MSPEPDQIPGFVEQLARSCYENRLEGFESEGACGKDKIEKKPHSNPRQVEFDQLPEVERQAYKRQAREIIRVIIANGYKIDPVEFTHRAELLDTSAFGSLRFRELFDLYRRHHHQWREQPRNFLIIGEQFLQCSEPVTAFEVFQSGLDAVENNPTCDLELRKRLQQKSAQALSDAMALQEAEDILTALYRAGARDGETMGLLAKVYKKRAISEDNTSHFALALDLYREGFDEAERQGEVDDAIYNGINAATMARLGGDAETSERIGTRVRALCHSKQCKSYWDVASLGECSLLEHDIATAAHWYTRAVEEAPQRDRLSMWQQARLICSRLDLDCGVLASIFAPPRVVVFSGHRLDDDRQNFVRFPVDCEEEVRSQLRQHVERLQPGFVYCSAACGSDILFIEETLRHGAEVHVFLPFPAAQFAAEFVAYAGESWLNRFREILERVDSVTTVSHWDIGLNDKSHEFCNLYILGAALMQHRSTGCDLQGLAVWDGIREPAHSGTAAVTGLWRDYGIEWEFLEPAGKGSFESMPDEPLEADCQRHVFLPMLFADVKGYSRLTGLQLYLFSRRFMAACAGIIEKHRDGVFSTRTAGDGLFIVFRDLDSAIATTRALRDMIATTDWSRSGLPRDLAARFALDCGPCYSYPDPVTGRIELCGAHVIRAARLEPVTPPGHIYASESFATLCAAVKVDAAFEAVGRIVLPKNYGEMQVYHLR